MQQHRCLHPGFRVRVRPSPLQAVPQPFLHRRCLRRLSRPPCRLLPLRRQSIRLQPLRSQAAHRLSTPTVQILTPQPSGATRGQQRLQEWLRLRRAVSRSLIFQRFCEDRPTKSGRSENRLASGPPPRSQSGNDPRKVGDSIASAPAYRYTFRF